MYIQNMCHLLNGLGTGHTRLAHIILGFPSQNFLLGPAKIYNNYLCGVGFGETVFLSKGNTKV